MQRAVPRLRIFLALLAWFAQLCLPLAHAATMAQPPSQMAGWCGDMARAQAFIATLPPELRPAAESSAGEHSLDACAKLCGVATTPPPPSAPHATVVLRAMGLEQALPARPLPAFRKPALTPPSHGPPILG